MKNGTALPSAQSEQVLPFLAPSRLEQVQNIVRQRLDKLGEGKCEHLVPNQEEALWQGRLGRLLWPQGLSNSCVRFKLGLSGPGTVSAWCWVSQAMLGLGQRLCAGKEHLGLLLSLVNHPQAES